MPRSHDARSFFGGLPRLPPHLEWPVGGPPEAAGPLMFAAQIDLAEIRLARSPLPRSGTLYFFYYACREWVEENEVRVLYHSGAGNEFPEREPPPSLPRYFNTGWPWLREDELIGRIGFKFPVRFVRATSYRGFLGESPDDDSVQQPTDQELRDLQESEFNARLAHEVTEPVPYFYQAVDSADASWPFVWAVIEHSARAVCDSIDRMFEYEYRLRGKPPETIAELRRIRDQAAAWIERASSHLPFEPCDEPTQRLYDQEWQSLTQSVKATRTHDCRPDEYQHEAVRLVCHLCAGTSPAAVALIPESFRQGLETVARWRPPKQTGARVKNPIHQMLGYGACVQSAPFDHADDVMLLQIHGDIEIDWHNNSGCALQFWIAPDALAKRDFDAVKVTFECD